MLFFCIKRQFKRKHYLEFNDFKSTFWGSIEDMSFITSLLIKLPIPAPPVVALGLELLLILVLVRLLVLPPTAPPLREELELFWRDKFRLVVEVAGLGREEWDGVWRRLQEKKQKNLLNPNRLTPRLF